MTPHLSRKELARREGVSQATVQRWDRDGIGPPRLKVGGRLVRYRLSDVEAWEAAQAASQGIAS